MEEKKDPNRSKCSRGGLNAERQIIKISNDLSTIEKKQTLEVRFPNLGTIYVIVPGSVFLFLSLPVSNRMPVNNIFAKYN